MLQINFRDIKMYFQYNSSVLQRFTQSKKTNDCFDYTNELSSFLILCPIIITAANNTQREKQ